MQVCSNFKLLYGRLQESVDMRRRKRKRRVPEIGCPTNFRKLTNGLPGIAEHEMALLREQAMAKVINVSDPDEEQHLSRVDNSPPVLGRKSSFASTGTSTTLGTNMSSITAVSTSMSSNITVDTDRGAGATAGSLNTVSYWPSYVTAPSIAPLRASSTAAKVLPPLISPVTPYSAREAARMSGGSVSPASVREERRF